LVPTSNDVHTSYIAPSFFFFIFSNYYYKNDDYCFGASN
jgi:hypothetical protein